MNEPLMHAMIAFAARCAERDPAPTQTEAQDLAREVADECGLDARDADALRHAAENFVAPLEVSPQDLLEDLPCPAVSAPDWQAGAAVELNACQMEASVLSPEAALFDAADDFAERLDVLIRDHDPRHAGTDTRFSAWTFVAFIEHHAAPQHGTEHDVALHRGTAPQSSPWNVWSLSCDLQVLDNVILMHHRAVVSQKKQKLLRSCDFYTRSHARRIRVRFEESVMDWCRPLFADQPGRPIAPRVHTASAFLTPSPVGADNAARFCRKMTELDAWQCIQTLFFFEHNPEQCSWPTQIDWSIDAMLPDRGSSTLEDSQDHWLRGWASPGRAHHPPSPPSPCLDHAARPDLSPPKRPRLDCRMTKNDRDIALSELAALFGRLVQAERNHDDLRLGFEDGVVGEQIAASIGQLAERDAMLVGRPMASYSASLARLAIATRGDQRRRPAVHRQLGEHISALTRLVTSGRPNPS